MVIVSPEQAARGFREQLCTAARAVDAPWFLMPVSSADAKAPVRRYRERVYCYELYHQLRPLSGGPLGKVAGAPEYTLSGEIDKAGLNAVIDGGRHKPDLVWHVPGQASGNATVVEVKTVDSARGAGVRKDLETLAAFLDADRGYHSAVLLVFGCGTAPAVRRNVMRQADGIELPPSTGERVELLWHEQPGGSPVSLGRLTAAG